ncbi:hypothetical protein GCM10009663_10830 [Kitasatospora arboriphila]|uniref:Uncharacterized protein n=1 Tax=Kitasatospora arboriphila TaxID=258052 RepID=A0ABN1TBG5_9ACTN
MNTDVRNAEFGYFAGGNQCDYACWKGTPLEASVESVVAKGGGVGAAAQATTSTARSSTTPAPPEPTRPPHRPTRTTAA